MTLRERVRPLQRQGQPVRHLDRRDRRHRQAGADRRGRAGAGVRHQQRRAADSRIEIINNNSVGGPSTRRSRCRRRPACRTTTSTRRCACATCGPAPTPFAQRVQAGVRETLRIGQPARQAGDHRPWPRGHPDSGELHLAAVLRAQQAGRGRAEQVDLHRGRPTRSTSRRSSTARCSRATTRRTSRCTTTSSRRWTRCTRT